MGDSKRRIARESMSIDHESSCPEKGGFFEDELVHSGAVSADGLARSSAVLRNTIALRIAFVLASATLASAATARADEPADQPLFGHVEIGHVLEWVDFGGDTSFASSAPPTTQPPPPPIAGSQLGISRGFAAGISVGVEARFLDVITWSIFGFEWLAVNPEGRWVSVDGTQAHATSGSHLRMTTAPGLRLDLGDLAVYGRIRASAGMTAVTLHGRRADGARYEQEWGSSRWELGYEAGASWTAHWVDAGIALRHHLLGTTGYGLSFVTSFRFV